MTVRQRPALDRSSLPMRLWSKAKRYAWDPAAIELSKDREQWRMLSRADRERFLRLFALFHGGEEAVTIEIMPLLRAIAAEGRLEEEIYLTSFLWEEAKHVDLFDRYFVTAHLDTAKRREFEALFLQRLATGRAGSDRAGSERARQPHG